MSNWRIDESKKEEKETPERRRKRSTETQNKNKCQNLTGSIEFGICSYFGFPCFFLSFLIWHFQCQLLFCLAIFQQPSCMFFSVPGGRSVIQRCPEMTNWGRPRGPRWQILPSRAQRYAMKNTNERNILQSTLKAKTKIFILLNKRKQKHVIVEGRKQRTLKKKKLWRKYPGKTFNWYSFLFAKETVASEDNKLGHFQNKKSELQNMQNTIYEMRSSADSNSNKYRIILLHFRV